MGNTSNLDTNHYGKISSYIPVTTLQTQLLYRHSVIHGIFLGVIAVPALLTVILEPLPWLHHQLQFYVLEAVSMDSTSFPNKTCLDLTIKKYLNQAQHADCNNLTFANLNNVDFIILSFIINVSINIDWVSTHLVTVNCHMFKNYPEIALLHKNWIKIFFGRNYNICQFLERIGKQIWW